MVLKEEFLNLINDINRVANEHGYVNGKDWANQAYIKGKLKYDEKEDLIRFIQMRNMVSHGGADRVNIFKEDIIRLEHYKKVLYDMLGIIIIKKINEVNAIKTKNNKKTKEFTPDPFNELLKPRYTGKASDKIRNMFIESKGKIHITTLTGKEYDVFLNYDGESFRTRALPLYNGYDFKIFDITYDLLVRSNGKVVKGNCRNYRLGEGKCTVDTLCGTLGYEYFGNKTGDSVFDTSFIVCAIMDYVGICKNTRGYLLLAK